ncbi:MAG TPA: ribonuclease HII [Chloroflexota bacterium]|nr:ribonuclease HII [Chloroflexota bacterium]
MEPSLAYEELLWRLGYCRVAGVDEVGRGALAGPLVAAAVILPPTPQVADQLAGVRDSKQLSPRARCALDRRIRAVALSVGLAVVPSALVDAAGLAAAGRLALCRAVAALDCEPDFMLVDGFRLLGSAIPHLALVRGDARCLSVAAASVVAKVARDRWMGALHARYPHYGFDCHKGYGTPTHLAALAVLGPCPEHRRTYAPLRSRGAT